MNEFEGKPSLWWIGMLGPEGMEDAKILLMMNFPNPMAFLVWKMPSMKCTNAMGSMANEAYENELQEGGN